ncbi:MAG: VWA domain-containing protein [Phycisphaerae bacterium]
MKFVSLSTLVWTAALAVPALLLLYFLKLRRQQHVISSTLLWRKAIEDLQVNAPFQRLRKNLLLFLQLLVLGAILFSLGQPVAKFLQARERTIVMLIDQSASMKAGESSGTRLDDLKRLATNFVDGLDPTDRAMVIGFSDRASVVCPFTGDKRQLRRQIESIEATDARTTLAEALQLAVAYSSRIVDVVGATTPQPSAPDADLELFSDGRVDDANSQVVQRGKMRYYRAGSAADNVGVVAMDVRRSYEHPGQVSLFARVENFGPQPVRTDVTLLLDGKILKVREVSLGPAAGATTAPAAPSPEASSASLAFEFAHDGSGTLELRIERRDALAADNVVQAVLSAPRGLSILGVSDRAGVQFGVKRVIDQMPGATLTWLTPDEYEKVPEATLVEGGRSRHDLVLLDAHDTARVPAGNYLFLGGVPRGAGVSAEGTVEDEHVVNWDETHPLMRYVLFDTVQIAQWRRLKLPPTAVRLVESETSTIVALVADPGRQILLLAFDLGDSDFPMRPAFVMFLMNAVRSLTASSGDAAALLRPGDTLNCPVPRGAEHCTLTRPDGRTTELDVARSALASYSDTRAVGIYRLRFDDADATTAAYAVNLLDRTESNIAPQERFSVGAERIARAEQTERANRPLWPYAVAAALLFLLIEWWIYNRRVMI